jgi:acyl carrier protein
MTRAEMFEELRAIIVETVDAIKNVEQIHETDTLQDLGIDSIDEVEIVSMAIKRFKIRIDRTKLGNVDDIEGLLNLFEEAMVPQ